MLILERRKGSSIRIGNEVSVSVRAIRGNAVKLAVRAPQDVKILRDELLEDWVAQPDPAELRRADNGFGIALVEDDPAHARLIQVALANHGYTSVDILQTGTDAIRTLASGPDCQQPQLILLDYRLPDLTGREVVTSLRATDRLRRTPIVMLSSCGKSENIQDCLEAGANAFVEKSPSFDEMEESLRTIADFWSHQRVRA